MNLKGLFLCLFFGTFASASTASKPSPTPAPTPLPSVAPKQPKIESLLKPQIYERAVKKRDIMTHAVLDDYAPDPQSKVVPYAAPISAPAGSPTPKASGGKIELKKYTYYSVMLVHATSTRARQVLTDYSLYSKLVPYVQKSEYDPKTQNLEIVGGVLGWTLHSWIHFEEKSASWIHFEVVAGHFQGMSGDIYFEPNGDNNTLVYLGGSQVLSAWPPKFILENGEEIVFGFTSNRMRSYIEAPEPVGKTNDGIPQPRSHL